MTNIMRLFVALAFVVPMAACGGGAAEGAGEGTTVADQYQGPVQSDDIATGEQLFTDVCGTCHMGGDGPDLTAETHGVATIRQTVREGDGDMPPLRPDRLSDEDLEAVLAYMVSIQAAE